MVVIHYEKCDIVHPDLLNFVNPYNHFFHALRCHTHTHTHMSSKSPTKNTKPFELFQVFIWIDIIISILMYGV